MSAETKTKKEITYIIPEDEETDNPGVTLQMDERSVLELLQYDHSGTIDAYTFLTLPQAYALHQALGQLLVRHQRSWGVRSPALRPV
jgi:hypothetical protein